MKSLKLNHFSIFTLSIWAVLLLIIASCSNSDQDKNEEELIKIGNKQSEEINIINFESNKPRNVILMIGDGMGPNQISLARIAIGGPDYRLAVDMMPHTGIVLTHSFGDIYTDSASSATAYSTGTKTINGYLSLDSNKEPLSILTEELYENGYVNGLVATSAITHATPAAFYAHVDDRDKEIEIAQQLIQASSISIALGGGKEYFENIEATEAVEIFYSTDEVRNSNNQSNARIIGLFDKDGIMRAENKPTQKEMTTMALTHLSNKAASCNGFFLMSEGSQIDWGGHLNNSSYVLAEFMDFESTLTDMMQFVNEDKNTLLIVTADHETGGLQLLGQQDDSLRIKFTTNQHSALPVNVYAYGPGADSFSGLMDNTEIFQKIAEALDYKNIQKSNCE